MSEQPERSACTRCFIFGALPVGYMPERPAAGDLVIAADKGYDIALGLGITPDITVGDFDSRGAAPQVDSLVRLQVRKDDTDVGHAVELGFERGYTRFVVYGGTGGLLDHTVANIAIAHDICLRGGCAVFYGDEYTFTVLHNASLSLPRRDSGRISVFALSDVARGVTIRGLSYEVRGIDLPRTSHRGVSNAFVGQPADISVADGELLILYQSPKLEKI